MSQFTTAPLFGSIVVGAMLAWLSLEDHGARAVLGWYALLMAVTFVRWRVARAYLRHPPPDEAVGRWRTAMLCLAAVAGATWSLSGTVLLPTDLQREIIVAVFFVGTSAAGMGSQSPVPYAYGALLIPFILPYAINQILIGGDRVVLGLAYLFYIPIMLVIARRQTRSFERQIRLAFENESLAEQLRHERDRTARINEELKVQVDELRTATRRIRALNYKLQAQTVELRAANKDLEGFSYSVSHDLRGPLRAIDGFSALLQEQPHVQQDPQARRFLARIRENIARMAALIDDLLAFARCGRQPLRREDLNMQELAEEAVQQVRAAYPERTVEIDVQPLPDARGDVALIRQVWANLLDNAVKYTMRIDAPRVIVTGREEGDWVRFEVSDNGVGFDNRYSDSLFLVFHRQHGSEYPGTGVGLAIVQRIVSRHGGDVWARSAPGEGSTFGFSLPVHELTDSGSRFGAATADEGFDREERGLHS